MRESGTSNSQQRAFEECNDIPPTCISFFFSYTCSELLKDEFMQEFQTIRWIIGRSILIINIGISLLKLAAESMQVFNKERLSLCKMARLLSRKCLGSLSVLRILEI